jgi:hypothetical protein
MPGIELSGNELRDAAQAARLAAAQAQKDATAQPNPTRISAAFAESVERYTRLAGKFEKARIRRAMIKAPTKRSPP